MQIIASSNEMNIYLTLSFSIKSEKSWIFIQFNIKHEWVKNRRIQDMVSLLFCKKWWWKLIFFLLFWILKMAVMNRLWYLKCDSLLALSFYIEIFEKKKEKRINEWRNVHWFDGCVQSNRMHHSHVLHVHGSEFGNAINWWTSNGIFHLEICSSKSHWNHHFCGIQYYCDSSFFSKIPFIGLFNFATCVACYTANLTNGNRAN